MVYAFKTLSFGKYHRIGKIPFPLHGNPAVLQRKGNIGFQDGARFFILLRFFILQQGFLRIGIVQFAYSNKLNGIIRHMIIPGYCQQIDNYRFTAVHLVTAPFW